jgi:hypothetical protein
MKIKALLFLAIAPLFFTGCASIIDGGPKTVQINSNPLGAKVMIFDKTGKEVSEITTPANVVLQRCRGYFKPEDYKLVFSAPGYYPSEAHVKSVMDGWCWGNALFAYVGVIGVLVIDPATGDAYTLSPREVNHNLVSSAVPLTSDELAAADLKLNPPPAPPKPIKSKQGQKN